MRRLLDCFSSFYKWMRTEPTKIGTIFCKISFKCVLLWVTYPSYKNCTIRIVLNSRKVSAVLRWVHLCKFLKEKSPSALLCLQFIALKSARALRRLCYIALEDFTMFTYVDSTFYCKSLSSTCCHPYLLWVISMTDSCSHACILSMSYMLCTYAN